ncbi:hypothetical protein QMO56_19825 [Roseomonas sp. E05]|uniref:hypothetical protein n=1 Tax=Roseomonas sp. E05 TaxID=3046310 RepID=UPI0024BBADE4|nr:hypothetical protein [Roseomonas sp. E05]MDJ0390366.1 hypothetical protein [Roseomonas sp. E05]
MSLGLNLLLNAAGSALDRLWLLRLGRDIGVLLPDYLDPGRVCPVEGAASAEEAALRETLLQIGRQMRTIGAVAVAKAVLQAPLAERRRAALLALAGSAAWQDVEGQPGVQQRRAAGGRRYLLSSQAAGGAAHAPHAIRAYRQQLWVLHDTAEPARLPGIAPCLSREDAPDCLSLDLALEEVALALRTAGEEGLAAQVAALRGCSGTFALPAPLPAAAFHRESAAA